MLLGMQDMFRDCEAWSRRVSATPGDLPNPSYGNHQGHASIEIVFDPVVVATRPSSKLLPVDPRTYEHQGSDFGPSYRFHFSRMNSRRRRHYDDCQNRSLWFLSRFCG